MSAARKAKTPQGGQAEGAFKTASSAFILHDLTESIKADLLQGKSVRLVDFPGELRPFAVAAIAQLRDDGTPIRCGWQTLRESHLSQTRLRARTYCIPGEFLREADHA